MIPHMVYFAICRPTTTKYTYVYLINATTTSLVNVVTYQHYVLLTEYINLYSFHIVYASYVRILCNLCMYYAIMYMYYAIMYVWSMQFMYVYLYDMPLWHYFTNIVLMLQFNEWNPITLYILNGVNDDYLRIG